MSVSGSSTDKRDPRGFDTSGPAARFLRHNALFVHQEMALGPRSATGDILADFVAVWTETAPLHRWIVDHVQG